MPKIRMAWGRKSDDRKTHSHGRWIPDNDHNRQVLQDSLAFFQGNEPVSYTHLTLPTSDLV